MRLAGIVALVILVVVGVVAIYRSPVFAITRVDVVGNARLTANEVRAIAGVPADATLLRFPSRAVKARLGADPWIASAQVSRDFPDGMRIRIVERVPYARVDEGQTLWLVDSGGWVIAKQSAEESSSLIVIRDVEDFKPVAGKLSTSAALRNALSVWAGISEELRKRVRMISAPSVDKTALITTDDVEIIIGSSEDIAKKDVVARRILDEQAGKVVYINVRSVDRPTVRGVPEPQ